MPSPTPATPPPIDPAGRRPGGLALLAGLVVLAVWSTGWSGVFQFDDYNVIVNFAPVHSWAAYLADLPRGLRPLLKASYTLNWTTGGVLGFHVFNTAVHLLCAGLVYLLARRMLAWAGSGAAAAPPGAAIAAALLFALHPVQTEAVTYISGRSASLMTLFYLAALLAHDQSQRHPARAGRWQALALCAFAAAMAVKETAITWPAAVLLWDACAQRRMGWGACWLRYRWYGLAAVGVGAVIVGHARYQRLLEFSAQLHSPWENLLTQVVGMGHLLVQWCLPWRTNIDPDLTVVGGGLWALAGTAACLASAAWALARCARFPVAAFALLWWLLQLLPIYTFFPRVDVVNDRQLYLAAWPLCVVLAQGTRTLPLSLRQRRALWITLLATMAVITMLRNQDYRSEVALWQSTVRLSPHKARAHNNLGYALYEAGDVAGAEAAYRRALELDPDYWLAQRNLDMLQEKP